MDYVDKNMVPLMAFYVLISSNFLGELYPCKLQKLLTSNMMTKHMLGLFTVFVTLGSLTNSSSKNFQQDVLQSIGIYTLFLLTTKSEASYILPSLAALGVAYTIHIYQDSKETFPKSLDKTGVEKKRLILFSDMKTNIVVISILIICMGVVVNVSKQKHQKGYDFSWKKFIIGDNKGCDSLLTPG